MGSIRFGGSYRDSNGAVPLGEPLRSIFRADSRSAVDEGSSQRSYTPLVDMLTAFGAVAVTAMLIFYALEPRSPWFVLAFAWACLASSVYGFLQGAWPFGVVELIWSGVAARRWWQRVNDARS